MGLVEVAGVDEHLLNLRQLVQGNFATDIGLGGHFAPADDCQSLSNHGLLYGIARGTLTGLIATQKYHAHRVASAQFGVEACPRLRAHEGIGHLQQQSAAISGAAICGNAAAVGHAGK